MTGAPPTFACRLVEHEVSMPVMHRLVGTAPACEGRDKHDQPCRDRVLAVLVGKWLARWFL